MADMQRQTLNYALFNKKPTEVQNLKENAPP